MKWIKANADIDQPRFVPLCATRRHFPEREARAVRARRRRSFEQAAMVHGHIAARQDAGAASGRHRNFRKRGHSRISGRDAGISAAPGGSITARRASRLDRVRIGHTQRYCPAADETAFAQKTKALTEKFARLEARLGAGPYFDGES